MVAQKLVCVGGVNTLVDLTPDDIALRDSDVAASIARKADYAANHKYKDDRRESYGDLGAQLDVMYWDKVNGTELWNEHVAAVKAAHGKPGG